VVSNRRREEGGERRRREEGGGRGVAATTTVPIPAPGINLKPLTPLLLLPPPTTTTTITTTTTTRFVQVALGLQHMHANHIMHRDLKTQNIFLLGNGRLVLGDLGISKILDGVQDLAQTVIGTPYYMSPEIFQSQVRGRVRARVREEGVEGKREEEREGRRREEEGGDCD